MGKMAVILAMAVTAAWGARAQDAAAVFYGMDTETYGAWFAPDGNGGHDFRYGELGYRIANGGGSDYANVPAGYAVEIQGQENHVDGSSRGDALLVPESEAQCRGIWFKGNGETFRIRVSVPVPTQVSLYGFDWDNQTYNWIAVTVSNTADTVLLDEQSVPYQRGVYLTWQVTGDVTFTVSAFDERNDDGKRPFIMGVFLDAVIRDEGIAALRLGEADIAGTVVPMGGATEVFLFWGETDETDDAGAWDDFRLAGTFSQEDAFVVTATNLATATPYYYNLMACSGADTSWVYTVASPSFYIGAPEAASLPASAVGTVSARLNGEVTVHYGTAGVVFDWWEVGDVVTNTIPMGERVTGTLFADIDGLSPLTPYAYAVTASNDFGAVTSTTETFMTQQPGGTFATVDEGDWNNPATWGGNVPPDGADATVNHAVTLTLPTFALASLTVNADITVSGWDTAITATTVTIADGATVTHLPQSATAAVGGTWIPDARVWFVCTDLTVSAGGAINVAAKGYGGFCGPGTTTVQNGYNSAGHGGRGGGWRGPTYGDPYEPVTPGSGGGISHEPQNGYPGSGGGVGR
ncbi:MAG: hypothetical protein FWF84_07960, partial [Kiritimatiellaeota bacterium]|nr:hypothetical protein [Kiritimatiellota bacterium]